LEGLDRQRRFIRTARATIELGRAPGRFGDFRHGSDVTKLGRAAYSCNWCVRYHIVGRLGRASTIR